jgi:hypothetical protein
VGFSQERLLRFMTGADIAEREMERWPLYRPAQRW